MPNIIIHGKVERGKFIPDDPDKRRKVISSFEGQRAEEILRKPKKPGSNRQGRYYFGVMLKDYLCEFTGYTVEECHDAMKEKFASEFDTEMKLRRTESYADMSTVRREEYHRDIRRWASLEYHLVIPKPNEIDY